MREAEERARGKDAGLGLPAFDEGGGDNAERARQLAVEDAKSKIDKATRGLVKGLCNDELAQLKEKLMGITGESISNVEASAVPARWAAQHDKFEAACKEGVEAWGSYWACKVRRVLQGGDGDGDGEAGEGAGFCLGRFPRFIEAVVDSVEGAVGAQKDKLVQELKEVGDGYYGRMSPWVKITTRFDETGPSITLACDHMAVVEKVMYCFVERTTRGILDEVTSKLVQVSGSVGDVDWIEACAEERKRLQDRIKHVAGARAQILTLLRVES